MESMLHKDFHMMDVIEFRSSLPPTMDGHRVRILLGKGPRAETICEKLSMLQREHRLETLDETVEFLIQQWER